MTLNEMMILCLPTEVFGPKSDPTGKITDHSGEVEKGDVFIAVAGASADGHAFIPDVIARGASVIIAERYEGDPNPPCTILKVKDSREILGRLGLAWYENPQTRLHLVGVTGTNGKTTVSTLIWQVLNRLGVTAAVLGTVEKRFGSTVVDSRLTTPGALELARDLKRAVKEGCSHLVMEVSSHALEQERINGLDFKVALFTNLSHDHLDYHGTVIAYASAKQRLFNDLKSDSTAIINGDDEHGRFMAEHTQASIWDVSFSDESVLKIVENGLNGLVLDLDGTLVQSPLMGRFNAYNVAQAWLACVALGFSEPNVAAALAGANGAPGRLERVMGHGAGPVVLVDYAHTPDAIKNVLETLSHLKKQGESIVVVFGCGGDRDRTKRPVMAAIAEKYADVIWVTSDNPRNEDPDAIIDEIMTGFSKLKNVHRETDRTKAIQKAVAAAGEKAMVLVAGKGHETYQEIKGVRHHLDDREVAQKALQSLNGQFKMKGS